MVAGIAIKVSVMNRAEVVQFTNVLLSSIPRIWSIIYNTVLVLENWTESETKYRAVSSQTFLGSPPQWSYTYDPAD